MIALITILCSLAGGLVGLMIANRQGELSYYGLGILLGPAGGAIIGFIVGVVLADRYYSGANSSTILGSSVGAISGYFIAYYLFWLRSREKDSAVAAARGYGVPIGVACGAIVGFIVGVRLSHG